MGLPCAWIGRGPYAVICGQIGIPHAVIGVSRKPIAEPVSRGQHLVRDRAGGKMSKKCVKGQPAFLFWLGLVWKGNGRMVVCQAPVGENTGRQPTYARETQFAEPLYLEIQSD